MVEQKLTTLEDLARIFSEQDPSFTNFHAKVFSPLLSEDQASQLINSIFKISKFVTPEKHPFIIAYGSFSNLLSQSISGFLNVKDGKIAAFLYQNRKNIPDCNTIAVISPYERNGRSSSYINAFRAIDYAKFLSTLEFGRSAIYDYLGDFDFDLNGVPTLSSNPFRTPQPEDFSSYVANTELTSQIQKQNPYIRSKIEVSLKIFSYALNLNDEMLRFFNYWTAIEIICATTSNGIRSILCKIYDSNPKYVDEKIHFREIARMRHELIHSGNFVALSAFQERLMHYYFWDILLYKIGCPTQKYAERFCLEQAPIAR